MTNIKLEMQLGKNMVELVTNMPQGDLYNIVDAYERRSLGDDFDAIGRGSYGAVYGYKDYAIKKLHNAEDDMNRDVEVLREIHTLDCIPTFYAVINNDLIITERIHGVTVKKYVDEDYKNSLGIDKDFLKKWNDSLLSVVKAGYSPHDLHSANVMICSKTLTPKLVDVGYFTKHHSDYSNHEVSEDRGYSNADSWTGSSLRNYIGRNERRAEKAKQYQLGAKVQLDINKIKMIHAG